MDAREFVTRLKTLPKSSVLLGAPASSAAVQRVEEQLGVKLPARLRDLLLVVDGVRFVHLQDTGNAEVDFWVAPRLVGTQDMVSAAQNLWAWDHANTGAFRRLLAITDDGNGEATAVDLQAANADDPPVYRAGHEDMERWSSQPVSASFSAHLGALAKSMTARTTKGAWRLF